MKKVLFLLVLFLVPSVVFGQSYFSVHNEWDYYSRVLQVSGLIQTGYSYSLRPISAEADSIAGHPWEGIYSFQKESEPTYRLSNGVKVDLFQPALFQSYNSTVPRGGQDGAIWQGRGYNAAVSAGAEISAGPLHVKFRPVMGMAQNRGFDTGPHVQPTKTVLGETVELHKFAYPYTRGIDYVQRYGDSAYSWFDWGDSSIELRYSGMRLALSNQRIWSGPGINTSLQFGYNAPGFRHLYLGTYRPLETVAGAFEFAYIFGKLKESDYYTVGRAIGSQSVNSLILIYKPWFTDSFFIGANRTFFFPYPENFSDYRQQARPLFEPGFKRSVKREVDADPDNQVISLFMRYMIPEHGFELYVEYGRNDHNMDLRDFKAQPDHYRAYTLGFLKTVSFQQHRLLSISFEMSQLEVPRSALTRGGGAIAGWYTHDKMVLGFSHEGQILGSGFGPGVNIQQLKTNLFDREGKMGLKLARIAYDNNRLDHNFDIFENANNKPVERWEVRNIELMIGAELTKFMDHGLEITAGVDLSYIMNQHHLVKNDLFNARFQMILKKNIRGWKR